MKLTRRRILLLGFVLLMIVAAAGGFLWASANACTLADADRIQSGMTKDEVEAILGHAHTTVRTPGGEYQCAWFLINGAISIEFRPDKTIGFVASFETRDGILGYLRRRLGW